MTEAKFTRNAPQDSGLISNITDIDFRAVTTGRPAELRAARVLLQAVGHGGGKTKDGARHHVVYEIVRLEPASDQHDADNITWEISHAYETRTSRGTQQTLPMLNSPAEQRESLLDAIKEWASEQDVPTKDLDVRWLDLFGGREHSASETVQAGSLLHLMEFARTIGAVEDPKAGEAGEDGDRSDGDADEEDRDGQDGEASGDGDGQDGEENGAEAGDGDAPQLAVAGVAFSEVTP